MPQDHSAAQQKDADQDWLAVLNAHDVQFLALDRHSDSGLLSLFRSQPGWTIDFEDEEAAILVRTVIVPMQGSQARTPDDARVVARGAWMMMPAGIDEKAGRRCSSES